MSIKNQICDKATFADFAGILEIEKEYFSNYAGLGGFVLNKKGG